MSPLCPPQKGRESPKFLCPSSSEKIKSLSGYWITIFYHFFLLGLESMHISICHHAAWIIVSYFAVIMLKTNALINVVYLYILAVFILHC